MPVQNGDQVLRLACGLVPPDKVTIVGKYRIDARKIARGGNLGVLEGQELVGQRCSKDVLRQGQNLEKLHYFGRQKAFAPDPARPACRSVVADHAESGCANIAVDGIGFGEGQSACCRKRVRPL